MCGRITHEYTWAQIHAHLERFGAGLDDTSISDDQPRASYNAAPKAQIPVLRMGEAGLVASMMLWWLVPSWSKTSDTKYSTFNAKSEEAAVKPSFRSPFKKRRCVLPASGFYEWRKEQGGKVKRPFYITRADGMPLYFAGLWDLWGNEGDEAALESCTILTTAPNAEMSGVHNRMPCILEPEQVAAWCDRSLTDPADISKFLGTAPDGLLVMHEVDPRVGNARKHNDWKLTHQITQTD